MKRDVFISYNMNSSTEQVLKISKLLEEKGISCWYAPRDVKDSYASGIVDAIGQCKLFLVLLNKDSNKSEHVKNEIGLAFEKLNHQEDIILLPFHMDNCEISDDVRYYLGRFHMVDGSLPPEEIRIGELVDRIALLLKQNETKEVEYNGIQVSNEIGNKTVNCQLTSSMVYPDNQFVGRECELNQIHQSLSSTENKLFLVGMGGIGKSEIAKMYCKKYATKNSVILWIPFSGSLMETIANDFILPIKGFSRENFPEADTREYFEQKLRLLKEITDESDLLVVDNFDVSDDPDLVKLCSGRYSVIFTTRSHQEGNSIPEIEISAITDEKELMEIFTSKYTRALDEESQNIVKEIIRHVNGHTLSIRLIGAAMQSRRITPKNMLALLENGVAGMAKQNAKAEDMIFGTLRNVFNLSSMSESEVKLLKNLSLFPQQGVTVEQFYKWCEFDDFDVIDGLIRNSWIIQNPVTDKVHLHPLVAEILAETYGDDPNFCETLLSNFEVSIQTMGAEFVKLDLSWRQMLGNYSASFLSKLPDEHPMYIRALRIRGTLAHQLSMREDAVRCYQKLLKITEDSKERVFLYGRLSHCQALAGDAQGAFNTAMEGMQMTGDISAKEFYERFGYHKNWLQVRLVESLRMLGNYDLSIEYGRRAIAIETKENFTNTSFQEGRGWALYHLAFSLYMRGHSEDNEEAWKLLHEAISLFGEVDDDWSQGFCYSLLAKIQLTRDKFDDALQYNMKASEILYRIQGEKHQNFCENLLLRGEIYRAMGKTELAKEIFAQAADIFQDLGLKKREKVALEQVDVMNVENAEIKIQNYRSVAL